MQYVGYMHIYLLGMIKSLIKLCFMDLMKKILILS